MGYIYRPSAAKKRAASIDKQDKRYLKIILIAQAINVTIVILAFFGFVLIFGNINYVWGLFRSREVYKENNAFKPSKPFLSVNKEYTKETNVDFEGTADSGNTVYLYRGEKKEKETVSDSNNKFYFGGVSIDQVQDQKTLFYVVSKSKEAVESDKSNVVTIIFDKKEPKFTISAPKNDEKISSFSRTLEVKGTVDADAEVAVNGRMARVNQNNDYSAQIRLEDGENIITVEVTDKAGNKSKQSIKVTFEKKTEG